MAFGGGGDSRRPMTDINVTPLVDVMLVLLIIFMVTAPLIQSGVKVDLPRASAQQMEHAEEKLVLTISRDRRIYLGNVGSTVDVRATTETNGNERWRVTRRAVRAPISRAA